MFYNHLVSNQFFKFFTSFVDFFSMELGALQTSNTFCIFKDKRTMKIVSVLPVWDITAVGSYTAVGIYSTIYPLSGSWVKGVPCHMYLFIPDKWESIRWNRKNTKFSFIYSLILNEVSPFSKNERIFWMHVSCEPIVYSLQWVLH